MAVYQKSVFNDPNMYMAMPIDLKRGNPVPLDASYVWDSKADAEDYAKNNATAYIGQILTVITTETDPDTSEVTYTVNLYQIIDAEGTLRDIGGGVDAVFEDARWTAIKNAVDTLTADKDTEGSLNYVFDQSKVTMEKETTTSSNVYTFYQGTHVESTEVEGETVETVVKTQIGKISIEKDIFINEASAVTVTKVIDPVTAAVSYVDSEGDTCPDSVTEEGLYLKMVMSNGNKIYLKASELTTGMIRTIKLDTYEYTADSDGLVTVTNVPVSLLTQGDTTIVLNGGDSTV